MTDPNLRLTDTRHFTRGLREDENRARRRARRFDISIEIAIVVLSCWALWLVTSETPDRWGFVIGLISQPFYMVGTWRSRRWGMFIVAVLISAIWLRGIVHHFF